MDESITKQLLNRDQIDNLISDCLKLKFTFQALLIKINSQTTVLSEFDKVYIEKKYSELLIELWLIEAPEHVDLSDPNKLCAVLSTLSSVNNFQECCSLIGGSIYHDLVCDFNKQSQLFKVHESNCIVRFKRACVYRIQEYTYFVKSEISFLTHLGQLLKTSQDPHKLCDKIHLTELVNNGVYDEACFRQFLLRFQMVDSNDKLILNLRHLGSVLLGVDKYYLLNDLKETVSSYLRDVTVHQSSADGRKVLEVSGTHIVISKVLQTVELQPRFSPIDEVRFVNSEVVHVDADLVSSNWHGKNIVLYTKSVIVDINRLYCWDVSGRNGAEAQKETINSRELSGADGNDGESGGNVMIVADNLVNGTNLIIISNGGNGSNGQNGRSGQNGKDGESLSNYEFEQKYPPVSRYRDSEKRVCLRTTYDNVIDELKSVDDVHFGDLPIGPVQTSSFKELLDKHVDGIGHIYFEVTKTNGCKITFSFYNRPLVPFSNCYSFLLFKGSPGSEGEAGGRGGKGGNKGFVGDINVHIKQSNNPCIKICQEGGISGKDGKRGNNGVCGKSGLDKAYMDISFIAVSWPVMFLPSEKDSVTLKVDYTLEDKGVCVYTPRGVYAQIIESKKDIHKSYHAEFDCHTPISRLHTSRKKTISLQDIVNKYRQKVTSANLCELSLCLEEMEQMIDVNIDKTKLQQVDEEISVKRVCSGTLSSKIHLPKFWFKCEPNASFDKVPLPEKPLKDISTLLKLVEKNPKDINNWINLVQARIDVGKLKHLWAMSLSLQIGKDGDPLLNEYVKNLLCNKLKLNILKQFDMQHLQSMAKELFHEVENVELKINKTVSVTSNSEKLCHERVKFFCEDSYKKRSEVKSICQNYTSETQLWEVVKTCSVEFTSSCFASLDVQMLFNKNKHFELHKQYEIGQKFCPLKQILMTSKDIQLHQMLLDGIVRIDSTKLFEVDRSLTFSSDVFVNKSHLIYCAAVKRVFDWCDSRNCSRRVRNMVTQLLDRIIVEKGPFSKCYRELLAYYFKINIIIYSAFNLHNSIEIVDNHNPRAAEKMHLLMKEDRFFLMDIDNLVVHLIKTLKGAGKLHSVLLHHVCSLTDFHQFDEFLDIKSFVSGDYVIDKSKAIKAKIKLMMTEDDDLITIKDHLFCEEDRIILSPRLEKLKMEYIGYGSIIHFMALHFKEEGNSTTAMELAVIINFVMESSTDAPYILPTISWIIAAHPQTRWLIEIVLLKYTLHIKKELDLELLQKLKRYLGELKEKDGLILLCEQISNSNEKSSIITVEHLEEVCYLMSRIPKSHIGLNDIDISEWTYYLKDKYWVYQLSTVTNWTEIQLNSISYFLSCLENAFGMKTCQKLLDVLLNLQNLSSSEKNLIENTFRELATTEIEINEELINSLSRMSIYQWLKVLKKHQKLGVERSVPQLLALIKESSNNSSNIQSILGEFEESSKLTNDIIVKLEEKITDAHKLKLWVSSLLKSLHARKESTSTLSKIKSLLPNFTVDYSSRLTGFLSSFFKQVPSGDYSSLLNELFNASSVNSSSADEHHMLNHILIATVFLAIGIVCKIKLRETQKLAVLMFLRSEKNILGQVSTGEGKSLIVVSVAIIKVLLNNHSVDIITSSHVLARRDALGYKDIYKLFSVSVGHNCHDGIEERKENYSNCQIVYGELANFQRDYLLDRFYDKNIMGDRKFQSIIVDEVDSMLLDQSSNMLYLSHDIPDLDKLEPVFVYIWKWLNIPGKFNQPTPSAQQLKESILFDIFGWLNKDQIKNLDISITDKQAYFTWERLISEGFISEKGQLLKHNIGEASFGDNVWCNCIPEEHFKYLMTKLIERDKQLEVPNHLKHFVLTHVDDWIKSAFDAMSLDNNRDYVVDIDRSSSNSDCNPNIILLDHDTGTDLTNSHWDGGLHQFLQLKHGCRLSLLSLKAVFISNISYFQCYETLYGLTGTLGSPRERDLLKDVYNVDFVTIPTSKPKSFVEYTPLICSSTDEWINTILKQVYDISHNRSALVICESVNDVIKLEQNCKEMLYSQEGERKIITYKRDYEKLKVAERLEPGYIIISTNLAGRGTDIKLSEKLVSAGGLHVCLTFLPSNKRTEEQAYGRVSRNGVPGSAQIIFLNQISTLCKVIDIKKLRDANELIKLTERKQDYENKIKLEEQNFKEFKETYEKLNKISQPKEVKTVLLQECINQWAFWLDDSYKNICATSISSFLNSILKLGEGDLRKWLEMVKNPSNLIKLGLFYIQEKQFTNSIYVLDKVINEEPYFSGIARYYRIFSKSMETDLCNDYVISELHLAKKHLKWRIDSLLVNMEMVDRLKLHDPQSNLQYESFKEQQENIIKMYLVHIESIDKIVGSNIDRIFLEDEHILNDLCNEQIVKKRQISSSLAVEELSFVKEYGLEPEQVFSFLTSIKGSEEFSLEKFVESCPLPSREVFWNELINNSILIGEEEYIMIDAEKLSNVDPSLKRRIEALAVDVVADAKNQVWLYRHEEIKYKFGLTLYDNISIRVAAEGNRIRQLEEQNIMMTNKRATLIRASKAHYRLSFDSISIEEFGKLRIGINTAEGILCELTEMRILKENISDAKKVFSLMVDINDLKYLKLSKYKEYSEDVKGLIFFHFAFRLAMKKLMYQLNEGDILSMPLQIMPHNGIVLKLVEREIIKSVLNKEKNLDALFPEGMEKQGWEKVFNKYFTEFESRKITTYLIANSYFVQVPFSLKHLPFINSEKYKANDLGIINVSLPVGGENEFNNLLKREQETIILLIKNQERKNVLLKEAQGSILKVEKTGFSFLPLADILRKNDFPTTELYIFSLNGFDQVLNIGEKKWSRKMKLCVLITTMIGAAQIGVGSALALTAVAIPLSDMLVSNGISDLVFSLSCYITGLFSWAAYLTNKVMSVALCFAAGLNKLFSSFFAKKTITAETLETTTNLAKSAIGKKEIIKTISARVAKSVGTGVVCNTLPTILEPHCQKISDFLVASFNSHIETVLDGHVIVKHIDSLNGAFEQGQCAKIMRNVLSESLSAHPSKRNTCWDVTIQKVIRILFEAMSTIQELKLLFCEPQICNPLSVVCSLGMLGKNVIDAVNSAKEGNFKDIFGIVTMLINDVDKRLLEKINSENIQITHPLEESYCQYPKDVVRKLKDIVKADLSCFIKENIVSPFLCSLGERILKQYSKSFLLDNGLSKLQHPEHNNLDNINAPYFFKFEEYDEVIKSKDELATIETDFEVKLNRTYQYLNLEYDHCLLKMFHQRGSCELFAEIVQKNLTADSSCLKLCCIVIPALLKRHGIHVPGLEIILHQNGHNKKYYSALCSASELTSVYMIHGGNIQSPSNQNKFLIQDVIEATCKGLANNHPEFSWNSEKMLKEILYAIKHDVKIRELMYICHKEKMKERGNYEQEPKLSPQFRNPLEYPYTKGKWKLNSSLDVDLRNAFDSNEHPANITVSHINKGFCAALKKVNDHIYKVQSHIKLPFKLYLDNFNTTEIEVIPPTSWPAKAPFECQFNHYELIMPFKVTESNELVDFNISLRLTNNRKLIQPHKPQGPHIIYEIEPSQNHIRYIGMGVKGHVLLNDECKNLEYSAGDCHIAGELILPSNFKFHEKKECEIIVVGDSLLNFISEYISRPLCEVLICKYRIESFVKTEIRCIPSCYTGIRCVVLHLGKSLFRRKRIDRIVIIVREMVEELSVHFKNITVFICGMHMCKDTHQFHLANESNANIVKLNSEIRSLCTSMRLRYIDTDSFIKPGDLRVNGVDLNRRGLMKLGRYIGNLNIDSGKVLRS